MQRHETTELSVKLQIKIVLCTKVKVLSKESHDISKRLNETRVLLETIVDEKERKLS